jgi:hypothetical protein
MRVADRRVDAVGVLEAGRVVGHGSRIGEWLDGQVGRRLAHAELVRAAVRRSQHLVAAITLTRAQHLIATDWVAAYHARFG